MADTETKRWYYRLRMRVVLCVDESSRCMASCVTVWMISRFGPRRRSGAWERKIQACPTSPETAWPDHSRWKVTDLEIGRVEKAARNRADRVGKPSRARRVALESLEHVGGRKAIADVLGAGKYSSPSGPRGGQDIHGGFVVRRAWVRLETSREMRMINETGLGGCI